MQNCPNNGLINNPCTYCKMPTSMWCSRCQTAWYCTPEHLQTDWPRHRKECVAVCDNQMQYNVSIMANHSEQLEHYITVTAVLFSPEEERPRIITVNCRPSYKSAHGACPVPLLQNHFQEGTSDSIVLTQGLNNEPLRFPLHLFYSPSSLQKGTPLNRSIFNITSGAAQKKWCGAVVVLKFNGSRRQGYSDAGSNDLPALSAYFLAYK